MSFRQPFPESCFQRPLFIVVPSRSAGVPGVSALKYTRAPRPRTSLRSFRRRGSRGRATLERVVGVALIALVASSSDCSAYFHLGSRFRADCSGGRPAFH